MNKMYPSWWHMKGYQMDIAKRSDMISLIIEDTKKIAKLTVVPDHNEILMMNWSIKHGEWSSAKGNIKIQMDALKAMFGLRKTCYENSRKWAKVFNADVFVPGIFIRRGLCLSVPGPRFAAKFDEPCLSIRINDSMKTEVSKFIKCHT